MNSIDFCFWLQGYFEISEDTHITSKQCDIIKAHLALTFKHEIDPLRESQTVTPVEVLNNVHNTVNNLQTGNDPLLRC